MDNPNTFLEDILDSSPSPGTLFLVLSRLKEEGDLERVIKECRRALEIYPEDLYLRRLLAETYFDSGMIPQAGEEIKKVIQGVDELISSYSLQTEILIHQEREKEAIESLRLFLAHRPDDRDALRLMESLGPLDETSEGPGPASPDIATPTLAEIYFDQGQLKRAIETYEKVIAGNPENPSILKRLDELRDMIGQDRADEDRDAERLRQQKIKMISVLEGWLAGIRHGK